MCLGVRSCVCGFECVRVSVLCGCVYLCDLEEGDQTSNRLGIEMNATGVWVCVTVSECVFHVCDYISLCVSIPFTDLVKIEIGNKCIVSGGVGVGMVGVGVGGGGGGVSEGGAV